MRLRQNQLDEVFHNKRSSEQLHNVQLILDLGNAFQEKSVFARFSEQDFLAQNRSESRLDRHFFGCLLVFEKENVFDHEEVGVLLRDPAGCEIFEKQTKHVNETPDISEPVQKPVNCTLVVCNSVADFIPVGHKVSLVISIILLKMRITLGGLVELKRTVKQL